MSSSTTIRSSSRPSGGKLARGGRVYYLHNRVETIDECAAKLKQQLGEDVSIAVAHGKMGEEGLSDVMQSLTNGDIQVLVCTTIIETGIDVPNVNTLIIEDADKFGLSQLHQLRGRVGRSSRHAYAYLTFRKGKCSPRSQKSASRPSANTRSSAPASRSRCATSRSVVRATCSAPEQSGHMMSVGYDMYLKLLEEAVLEEQGEGALKEPECTADLNIAANIAKTYVTSGEQRMDLYRRMAAIRSQSDADDLLDEIVDRYGDPPKGVLNLIDVALLRARLPPRHHRDQPEGHIRHDLHGRAGLCSRLGLLCRAGVQGTHLLRRGQAAAAHRSSSPKARTR